MDSKRTHPARIPVRIHFHGIIFITPRSEESRKGNDGRSLGSSGWVYLRCRRRGGVEMALSTTEEREGIEDEESVAGSTESWDGDGNDDGKEMN